MKDRRIIDSNMNLIGYDGLSKTALFENASTKQSYMVVQDFDLNTRSYSVDFCAETKEAAYEIFAEQTFFHNPYMELGSTVSILKDSLKAKGYRVHRKDVEELYEHLCMDKLIKEGELLNPKIIEDCIQKLRIREASEYKHEIRILDDVIDILEEHGWNVEKYGDGSMDIRMESGLGEDFGFEVDSVNLESCIEEIKKYAHEFDYEEHASVWIRMSEDEKARCGVPESNKDLLDDAKEIQNNLLVLRCALSSCPILKQQTKGREERTL